MYKKNADKNIKNLLRPVILTFFEVLKTWGSILLIISCFVVGDILLIGDRGYEMIISGFIILTILCVIIIIESLLILTIIFFEKSRIIIMWVVILTPCILVIIVGGLYIYTAYINEIQFTRIAVSLGNEEFLIIRKFWTEDQLLIEAIRILESEFDWSFISEHLTVEELVDLVNKSNNNLEQLRVNLEKKKQEWIELIN